ncbi:MAG: DUF2225 domain-containing protein [Gemmatimonadota bacterium]
MLSEQELQQICRAYTIACPACSAETVHYRLKRDIVRATNQEGDGHPIGYRWQKPGFDSVDPLQYFMGVCPKCGFAGEIDDADYRTCGENQEYRKLFVEASLQQLKGAAATGKGAAQSLLKRISDTDPLGSAVAKLHLGVFTQSLRVRPVAGNMARFYLRIAWLYRDKDRYYADADLPAFAERLAKARGRWEKEVPEHKDNPVPPGLATNEVEALRLSRSFFERNYETLQKAGLEDELRLRLLLAEIGYRLYELSNDPGDYKKAASFFSGTMQQCLKIISDKSIVGGVVNRAREMLEKSGDRGRQLRDLYKSRGGAEGEGVAAAPGADQKPKAKKTGEPAAGNGKGAGSAGPESRPAPAAKSNGQQPVAAAASGVEGDRATRQIALLTAEVEGLKTRLKELEEDNQRWRQLIGKDPLTGLPNKISLFRINLPKLFKSFPGSGPVTCIAIGLDQLGKVNLEHGWLMGDRMLQASAKSLARLLGEGEELYRIDGANFAVTTKMDGNAARQRVALMRRGLGGANVQVDKTTMPLAASIGVVTVEQKVTKSDTEVANAVYEALLTTLYRAKDKGGNTAEIHNLTRF